MQGDLSKYFPILFPFFFAAMWLGVSTVLALKAHWFELARRYPDRAEDPSLRLRFQSGRMSGVAMSGILTLDVCVTGLRVSIWRLFGPFSRPFFVPWNELSVTRRKMFFVLNVAELDFGRIGNLIIPAHVADRLGGIAQLHWPEPGPFPQETSKRAIQYEFRSWLVGTTFAATFFIVAPRIMAPGAAAPPIAVAILFPAIVFGIVALIRFAIRSRS